MIPPTPVPSTKDGRRIVARLRRQSSHGATYPEAGSQPRWTANSSMSMIPSQKCGTDRPESARTLAATAIGLPWRTAAMMPVGMPITSAIAIEQTASSTVTGSLAAMSCDTGILFRIDSPKSPRSTRPIQIPYWMGTGRSRWYFWRIAATATGSCSSPASATAGSPGRSCWSEKMRTETKNNVGTSTTRRRRTYRGKVMARSRRRPRPARQESFRPLNRMMPSG